VLDEERRDLRVDLLCAETDWIAGRRCGSSAASRAGATAAATISAATVAAAGRRVRIRVVARLDGFIRLALCAFRLDERRHARRADEDHGALHLRRHLCEVRVELRLRRAWRR